MTAQRAEVLDSAYARDRAVMVARHLRARGIDDPLLLAAMGDVPRERDAWIWFAETQAVAARPVHAHGPEETYPFGL